MLSEYIGFWQPALRARPKACPKRLRRPVGMCALFVFPSVAHAAVSNQYVPGATPTIHTGHTAARTRDTRTRHPYRVSCSKLHRELAVAFLSSSPFTPSLRAHLLALLARLLALPLVVLLALADALARCRHVEVKFLTRFLPVRVAKLRLDHGGGRREEQQGDQEHRQLHVSTVSA